MNKTNYNHLFDVERKMREIKTLHALNKIPTKDAKLILKDLEASFDALLSQLPQEQREFFEKNRFQNTQ